MAEAISSNSDLLTCPICLDLLGDPVTIPCGHSYCIGCINGYWKDQRVYTCPQCRQDFTPKPILNKNTIVAELIEQIRRIRSPVAAPVHCYSQTESGDVYCDVCTDRKAVKSCLDCVLSYCETHLKVHNDVNPGKKHKVVDVTGQLQEKICVQHEKPLEIFCRTDQVCVCLLCLVDGHKDHDTVLASAGKKEKQIEIQRRFQQRIQEREKDLQELREAVETLKSSVQTAVEDCERIFAEMIRSIERRRSEVTELIRAQEKAEVSRAEGLLKQLEQEIAELKRGDAELEQLSHTEDHIYFLKNFQSVSNVTESKDLSKTYINQSFFFDAVKKSVSSLKVQLRDFCEKEFMKISAAVTKVQIILPCEPTTRDKLLQYSCHFRLDPNTTHRELHLSEGNRRVERRPKAQPYPDHPERFDGCCYQVLCREGVSGCCYWEVEWHGEVNLAVSYRNIQRKGVVNAGKFGRNDLSWSLILSRSSSYFRHNNIEIKLPLVATSKIGVYVDHKGGTLAFYSISDTMTLLYKIQTTFTDILYPGFGFGLGIGSSVQLL